MGEPQDVDEQSDQPDLRDTIALVRSPGMVVQYYGKRQVGHPPVVGVFLADEDVDDILRRSEPPEHDRWDPNADRLEPAKKERDVVQAIHSRIWHELRMFQKTARPPEKATGNKFRQLERELAKMFGPTGKREPLGVGKGETPISLRSEVGVVQEGRGLRMKGKVTVQLKDDSDASLPVVVSLDLSSVDEGGHHIDPIALTAVFEGAAADSFENNEWRLALPPGKRIEISVESVPYEPDWTVEFVPSVRPLGEGVIE